MGNDHFNIQITKGIQKLNKSHFKFFHHQNDLKN